MSHDPKLHRIINGGKQTACGIALRADKYAPMEYDSDRGRVYRAVDDDDITCKKCPRLLPA